MSSQEWLGKTDSDFLPDPEEGRRVMENDQIVLKTLRPLKLIEEVKNPGNKEPCYWLSYKFPFNDYATGDRVLDHITVSIGIAVSEPGIKLEDLLRRANQAMLEAKRTGKNRVVEYESILQGESTVKSADFFGLFNA